MELKESFPEYDGAAGDFDAAVDFIREQFLARNEFPERKKIYVHVTCATDQQNIQFTFSAVKDIVVRRELGDAGLV